jgi:hypothetical protein
MFRSARRFHSWMHRLALLAVLLVAVMPSINRWVNAESASASSVISLAMCTSDGMSWVKPAHFQFGSEQPSETGGAMLDEHCGYCVLLASLVPVLLALALFFFVRRRAVLFCWSLAPARTAVLLRGLGARGPPVLL